MTLESSFSIGSKPVLPLEPFGSGIVQKIVEMLLDRRLKNMLFFCKLTTLPSILRAPEVKRATTVVGGLALHDFLSLDPTSAWGGDASERTRIRSWSTVFGARKASRREPFSVGPCSSV